MFSQWEVTLLLFRCCCCCSCLVTSTTRGVNNRLRISIRIQARFLIILTALKMDAICREKKIAKIFLIRIIRQIGKSRVKSNNFFIFFFFKIFLRANSSPFYHSFNEDESRHNSHETILKINKIESRNIFPQRTTRPRALKKKFFFLFIVIFNLFLIPFRIN